MEGAKPHIIDRAARRQRLIQHPRTEGGEIGLGIQTAADAGLVGDDEDVPAGSGCGAERVECPGYELEPRPVADPAMVMVQHAVPVQKESAAVQQRGQCGAGAGELIRHADVDERAEPHAAA